MKSISTKLQRSIIRKYNRYHMSQHTPHNRVGLHKIQQQDDAFLWCKKGKNSDSVVDDPQIYNLK
jgi:hypothetical protein